MELRFGECTAGGSIRYDDWAGVDPTRIVAVKIGLLIHSSARVLEEVDAQSYRLAGVQIDPSDADNGNPSYSDDRRLRRAFSTTVDLRNEHVMEC
jgi:type IV pilus assembly protein PilW